MQAARLNFKGKRWEVFLPPFSEGYPIFSACFVCPGCLKQWFIIEVDNRPRFEIRGIPCEACPEASHPDLRPVPGSFIDNLTPSGYDIELLKALPQDLLRREFNLHLKAFTQPKESKCPPNNQLYHTPNPVSSRESTY